MLAVVQDYTAKINVYALGLLYQFLPTQFPQLADPNADPIVTYVAQVRADIARRNAALSTLTVGSQIGYLVIYGGTSDVAGGVTSDMWIFDTLSLLWHVPVRSDVNGQSRGILLRIRSAIAFPSHFLLISIYLVRVRTIFSLNF